MNAIKTFYLRWKAYFVTLTLFFTISGLYLLKLSSEHTQRLNFWAHQLGESQLNSLESHLTVSLENETRFILQFIKAQKPNESLSVGKIPTTLKLLSGAHPALVRASLYNAQFKLLDRVYLNTEVTGLNDKANIQFDKSYAFEFSKPSESDFRSLAAYDEHSKRPILRTLVEATNTYALVLDFDPALFLKEWPFSEGFQLLVTDSNGHLLYQNIPTFTHREDLTNTPFFKAAEKSDDASGHLLLNMPGFIKNTWVNYTVTSDWDLWFFSFQNLGSLELQLAKKDKKISYEPLLAALLVLASTAFVFSRFQSRTSDPQQNPAQETNPSKAGLAVAASDQRKPKWDHWPEPLKSEFRISGYRSNAYVLNAQLVDIKKWLEFNTSSDTSQHELFLEFKDRWQQYCALVVETAKENDAWVEFHQGHRFSVIWLNLPDDDEKGIDFKRRLQTTQFTILALEEAFDALEIGQISFGLDHGPIYLYPLTNQESETDWTLVGDIIETAERASSLAFDLKVKTVITERAAETLSGAFELERLSAADDWTPALFTLTEAIDLSEPLEPEPESEPEESNQDSSASAA